MRWVLDHLLVHPDSRAWGVDPWEEVIGLPTVPPRLIEQAARRALAPYLNKLFIRKGPSHAFLLQAGSWGIPFDLIYIDGSHKIPDVYADTGLAWKCLADGGLMIWDDYKRGVKRAIDTFVKHVACEIAWSTKRQMAVRKVGEA